MAPKAPHFPAKAKNVIFLFMRRAWQDKVRRQLETLLGDFRPPVRWEAQIETTLEFPDHVREQWILAASSFSTVVTSRTGMSLTDC